jgi:hypothetical protein
MRVNVNEKSLLIDFDLGLKFGVCS